MWLEPTTVREMGSTARKTMEVRKSAPPPLDAQPMIVPGSIQLGVEK